MWALFFMLVLLCDEFLCFEPQNKIELLDAVKYWVNMREDPESKYGMMGTWDVSKITDMSYLFRQASNFNDDIGNWNTGRVTTMRGMFRGSSAFNRPIADWNTAAVTDMYGMFRDAGSFDNPIGKWNTGRVSDMRFMFYGAGVFNQHLGNWSTGRVTGMDEMFFKATVFNNKVGDWNTGSVTSLYCVFGHVYSFDQPLSEWNTGSVTSLSYTFYKVSSFNHPIGKWNIHVVNQMEGMFHTAIYFDQQLEQMDTSSVTTMECMFCYASAFNKPLHRWDTRSVTTMRDMFFGAFSFNAPVASWKLRSVTDMASIFQGANSFCQQITSWASSNVYNQAVSSLSDGSKICNACDKYFDSCSSCSQDGCVECGNSTYLHEARCVEFCPARVFGNVSSRVCDNCEPSCERCVNASLCTECTDSKYLHEDKCFYFCPLGTVARGDLLVTGKYCLPCSEHCASCIDDTMCLLCTNFRYLHNGDCFEECPDGSLTSGSGVSGRSCEPCEAHCSSCSDKVTCVSCRDKYLYGGDCLDACPTGTFGNQSGAVGLSCQPCNQHCSSCVNSSSCLVCADAKYLYDGYCLDVCPPGSTPLNVGSIGSKCVVCQDYWHNDDCVERCPGGTYAEDCRPCPGGTPCRACANHCSSCTNDFDCLVCSDSKYLHKDICVDECPLGTAPIGFADVGRVCQSCEDSDCAVCGTVSICEGCGNSAYLFNGHCITSCPSGTVHFGSGVYGRSCWDCEDHCLSCSNVSAAICNRCTDSKYLHNGDCLNECPSGTIRSGDEKDGRTCLLCEADCSFCSSPTICLGCKNGKYLDNEDCVDDCPGGTFRSGAGSDGLICQRVGGCDYGFTQSFETGECKPNYFMLAGCFFFISLLLMAIVLLIVRQRARMALLRAIDANKEKQIEAALNLARNARMRSTNQTVKAAHHQLKVLRNKYTEYEMLLQVLDRGAVFGDMKLIHGSWLIDPRHIRRFKRQQELPQQAFWSPDGLRSQLTVVDIVAISYCWLHAVNPDPRSQHLQMIQRAIDLRLRLEGPGQKEDLSIFVDFLSLPQHGEKGDESAPTRGNPRSESEQKAFERGLKNVNILYASQLTEVWLMKWVPDNEPRKYMTRGWPFFEQAVSTLIKAATMLIDIEPDIVQDRSWIQTHQKGKLGRRPPMTPSRFEEELDSKSFTSPKADKEFVRDKYVETFTEVIGTSRVLWFVGLGWTDVDAEVFKEIFPFATKLDRLLLGNNQFSKYGAERIIAGCVHCPTLEHLDLSSNKFSVDDANALRQIWSSLGKPPNSLRLEGSSRDSIVRPVGSIEWSRGVESCCTSTSEKTVDQSRAKAVNDLENIATMIGSECLDASVATRQVSEVSLANLRQISEISLVNL